MGASLYEVQVVCANADVDKVAQATAPAKATLLRSIGFIGWSSLSCSNGAFYSPKFLLMPHAQM